LSILKAFFVCTNLLTYKVLRKYHADLKEFFRNSFFLSGFFNACSTTTKNASYSFFIINRCAWEYCVFIVSGPRVNGQNKRSVVLSSPSCKKSAAGGVFAVDKLAGSKKPSVGRFVSHTWPASAGRDK
jgi:hypothetical protein